MIIRKGAPWVAAFAILGAGSAALAGHIGATNYPSGGCCDAQTNFCAGQQVVYDTVVEKRYRTEYQTTTETVMKPCTKTTNTS